MIRRFLLSREEIVADDLDGFFVSVHNLSSGTIYASTRPNITPESEFAAEIPAGCTQMVSAPQHKLYLLGTVKGYVTLSGHDDYSMDNNQSAQNVYSEGGSGVSKEYVDSRDALFLDEAKNHADTIKEELDQQLSKASESISALQTEKADKSEIAEALNSANGYTDKQIGEVNESMTELEQNKADKSEIPTVSNPNLLDNWYFADPINQRGVSGTISDAGYFIDRWKLTEGSVTISNGGLTLNGTIAQILENAPERNMTASYLTSEGVRSAEYNSATKTFSVTANGVLIIAAKLELGNSQTLANEENNNWALNDPPPNKTTELLKCQRYYYRSKSSEGSAGSNIGICANPNYLLCGIHFPVKMRVSPKITFDTLTTWEDGRTNLVTTSNPTPGGVAEEGFLFLETTTSTLKIGGIYCLSYTANAEP